MSKECSQTCQTSPCPFVEHAPKEYTCLKCGKTRDLNRLGFGEFLWAVAVTGVIILLL